MPRLLIAVMFALALPAQAMAERITTRTDFLLLVDQRRLTATGITLTVTPDGQITGRAFGRAVTGSWSWDEGGWFCRRLGWGRQSWPLNCQLVTRDGDRLRFTADRGTGDSATLRLR